jgi:hypothetical protein
VSAPETMVETIETQAARVAALLAVRIVSGVGTPADVEQLRNLRAHQGDGRRRPEGPFGAAA